VSCEYPKLHHAALLWVQSRQAIERVIQIQQIHILSSDDMIALSIDYLEYSPPRLKTLRLLA
jgi:hypothetical protein